MLNKSFIYLVSIVLVVVNTGCQSEREMASNSADISEIPDQEGWNSTLISTSKGKTSSKIIYTHMQKFSNKDEIRFLESVEVELFDEKGLKVTSVHAETGVLNHGTRNFTLTGDVVVKSSDNIQLFTESLIWDQKTEKITSDAFVTVITAENDTIYGHGFESEPSLKNWTILEPSGVTQKKLNLDVEHEDN